MKEKIKEIDEKSYTSEIIASWHKIISENQEAFRTIINAIIRAYDDLSPGAKEEIRGYSGKINQIFGIRRKEE